MKIKKKNLLIITIILGLSSVGVFYYTTKDHKEEKNTKETTTSYSSKSIKKMEDLGIKNKVDTKKYNKTLDTAIFDESFSKNYVEYYLGVKYYDNKNLISYINNLAKDGSSINEINEIFEKFIKYKNFDINNAKRYLSYSFKNKDLDNQDIVTRVNLSLDKPYYTDTKKIENQSDIFALVNKYNYVSTTYVPSNLKSLFNISSLKMVDVAADAYEEFVKGAKADGITFIGTTAYRSAAWQKELYDSYVNRDGVEKADTYSARPGYSEHQLGYSVDLNDPNYKEKRISPSDYEWIKNNAYKYGFIIRYPEGKENITGYSEENWHLRYVGKDVAKEIHDKNITFDEYYDLYIKEYNN